VATNRRISEFPEIAGTTIDEPDLLTLVHVFEVDPVLRNKRITFSGFKDYLNQYYTPSSGGVFNGNVIISGNLTVTGTTNVNTITGSDLATFSGVFVQNNLEAAGTISGLTVTGTNGEFTNLTAVSGRFTDRISGATITGDNVQVANITGVSGVFTSFTGTVIQSTSITGVSGVFTSQLSGSVITGDTGQFSNITGVSGTFTSNLSGETVTGTNANFTTGTFGTIVAGSHTVTGNLLVSGDLSVEGSGYFSSGVQITGTGLATLVQVFKSPVPYLAPQLLALRHSSLRLPVNLAYLLAKSPEQQLLETLYKLAQLPVILPDLPQLREQRSPDPI